MRELNGKIELADRGIVDMLQMLRLSEVVLRKAFQAVESNRISEVQFKDILKKCSNGEITEIEALALLE